MKNKMIWVNVNELIEQSNDFQVISKIKDGNTLWCLTQKDVPIMYQKKMVNTQPFYNVFCLVETDIKMTKFSPIKVHALGVSHRNNTAESYLDSM